VKVAKKKEAPCYVATPPAVPPVQVLKDVDFQHFFKAFLTIYTFAYESFLNDSKKKIVAIIMRERNIIVYIVIIYCGGVTECAAFCATCPLSFPSL
jgi:hypothetical protein